MRLVDLNPRWAMDADIVIGGVSRHYDGRHGMALTFDCPHCLARGDDKSDRRVERLGVWFANPIDGLPPTDDATHLWTREGATFDTLTLSPSVDASGVGHWHGHIVAGAIQ